jgi:hypothetical protein
MHDDIEHLLGGWIDRIGWSLRSFIIFEYTHNYELEPYIRIYYETSYSY